MFVRIRRVLGTASLTFLIAILALMLFNMRAVSDWFRLRGYTPPSAISALADATAMTTKARHLFYVNHPAVDDKADFRGNCPNFGEHTIVIGCYQAGERGIYVLSVNDQRLAGVEQVTAAHEMLHAAYERLSGAEKQRINGLLRTYADTQLTDNRIKATLKSYETSEPGEQLNEMHSIFGTEVANLSPELENYYGRYFTSRKAVVAYAQRYQAAFTSRQTAIADYDQQLKTLAARIKTGTDRLAAQESQIDADRKRLDAERQSGNVDDYNAGVAPFNARIAAYNALISDTRTLIGQYNAIVDARNAIAAQTLELQQAIDSSKLPSNR